MSGYCSILTRSEARRFLRTPGSKVAIQVGYEGKYVFAVKADFVEEILVGVGKSLGDNFVDYNGKPSEAFVEYNILHMPIGVT